MSERFPTISNHPAVRASGDDDDKEGGKNWVFEHLRRTRTLQLFGTVNTPSAKKVISGLLFLEGDNPDKPITLVMNSPGGSVTDGFAIYDTIRFVQPQVRIVCVGLCASIATIILLGADKRYRVSLPHTEFLIHQPLIPGSVYGRASDLEITAREILKTRERINRMLSHETGQDLETVQSHTQRDYWMNAREAINYGLISGIIEGRSDLEAR